MTTPVFAGPLPKGGEQAAGTAHLRAATPGGKEHLFSHKRGSGPMGAGSWAAACPGAPGIPVSAFHCSGAVRVLGTESKVGARYLDTVPGSAWVGGQREC